MSQASPILIGCVSALLKDIWECGWGIKVKDQETCLSNFNLELELENHFFSQRAELSSS